VKIGLIYNKLAKKSINKYFKLTLYLLKKVNLFIFPENLIATK